MPHVVTLEDFRPIPRYDTLPWTDARIEEASAREGPWAEVESFALSPIDADPTAPAARDFTTDLATVVDGWYRIVWLDAIENTSTSEEIRALGTGSIPPTVSELRNRSALIRTQYPADPFSAQVEQDLEFARDLSVRLVESLTCRTMDETLPEKDVPLATQAIVMKTEQMLMATSAESSSSRLSGRGLKSISAGPWSETYFGPEEASKAKMLDPDPRLNEILWALTTPECQANWMGIWTGVYAPAAAITEVAWGIRGYLYERY